MEAESKNSKFCVKYIPKATHTQKIRSLPKKMTPYLTDYENVAEPPPPFFPPCSVFLTEQELLPNKLMDFLECTSPLAIFANNF